MSKFFKELKAALEEAIAHKEGRIKLRSTIHEVPNLKDQAEALQYLNKTVNNPVTDLFIRSSSNE